MGKALENLYLQCFSIKPVFCLIQKNILLKRQICVIIFSAILQIIDYLGFSGIAVDKEQMCNHLLLDFYLGLLQTFFHTIFVQTFKFQIFLSGIG